MNGFNFNQYNPYSFMNPYQQQVQPTQPQTQVVRVNGENGARAYQMGANSSALLLDESGLMIWLVTSDGAGYKTVTNYDIKPHQELPKPDYTTLESRIERLEMIVNGNTRNPSATCNEQSNASERKANDGNAKRSTKSTGNAESNDV